MTDLPPGPFDLLLLDPPWAYGQRAPHSKTRFGGGCRTHYPVMSDAELRALPVGDIAANRALMFMWATWPRLELAMELIGAYGFVFCTVGFLWVKTDPQSGTVFHGPGFYTKANSEPCLLARRGRAMKPAVDDVSRVILSPRREHSRKPEAARSRIDRMYPTARKVELFAREAPAGWTTFGNQAEASPFGRQARLFDAEAAP
jgi:N6-adenosine-specific RNA methylase IME4